MNTYLITYKKLGEIYGEYGVYVDGDTVLDALKKLSPREGNNSDIQIIKITLIEPVFMLSEE